MKTCTQLKPFVLITDYVACITTETEKAFAGTTYVDDWFFYHDALSLMIVAQCKTWMDKQGFLKRWIILSADLYNRYPDLHKKFGRNPYGNTPKIIPWNLSLNDDIYRHHGNHIQITTELPKNHSLKFSELTTNKMAKSYCQLLDRSCGGCVTTYNRIFQHKTGPSLHAKNS